MWGAGPPLLFVQAWSASIAHHTSPWVREWIDKVAAGRTFAIMDRRGTGASQRDITDLSLDAQIADIEAVMDHAGLRESAIFSVADGAAVCIAFAARRPQRVVRLVLWCPLAAGAQIGGASALSATADLMQRNFRLGTRAYADIVVPSGTPEELRRYREDIRNDADPDLWPFHYRLLATLDVRPELPKVQAPTLVIHRRGAIAVPLEAGKSVAAMVPDARMMVIDGDSAHQSLGDQSYVDQMLDFIDEDRLSASPDDRAAVGPFRTVLFTDLVSHTEMMSRLGDERGREVLREYETIARNVLKQFSGTEVKTMGDGFMVSFVSVTKAVECAIALQRAFAEREGEPLSVRVGLNAGEPIEEDGDLFGATVILASRIAAKAQGGEILVADTVRGLCSGKGFLFTDRGEFLAKGFEDPVRVYEVSWRH